MSLGNKFNPADMGMRPVLATAASEHQDRDTGTEQDDDRHDLKKQIPPRSPF